MTYMYCYPNHVLSLHQWPQQPFLPWSGFHLENDFFLVDFFSFFGGGGRDGRKLPLGLVGFAVSKV